MKKISYVVILAAALALGCWWLDRAGILSLKPAGGLSLGQLGTALAAGYVCAGLATWLMHLLFARRKRPFAETWMVWRLSLFIASVGGIILVLGAIGLLSTLGSFLGLFGGMLLGLSMQAPMGGLVAWILVSMKRPFRPGDRVQLPRLSLIGDVLDVSAMYTTLNQVGGSVAGDEPVGRHILIPNALLFSEVMINYTADQNAAYMLDEVVVRITYDSDWKAAEEILLQAASAVTHDVIAATNRSPYIRADLYDYGVYMRLRYLTRVQERARTSYRILKRVFAAIQASPVVDVAIPYVYSFRAAADRKENGAERSPAAHEIHEIDVEAIRGEPAPKDEKAVAELAEAIGREGLLQPIVVCEGVSPGSYEILAGDLRYWACRRLGWRKIPAVLGQASPRAASLPRGGALPADYAPASPSA
ncbi:MAG: ParB N-terminal domain-containing protein [Thermoguttaceae bacterium]